MAKSLIIKVYTLAEVNALSTWRKVCLRSDQGLNLMRVPNVESVVLL